MSEIADRSPSLNPHYLLSNVLRIQIKTGKSTAVTNVTDSEARMQEKLRERQERDRQRRAEEIVEQREERLAIRRERDRASRQLYVLPRRDTHAWIRTELIINAGKHQRLPRRDMHVRESLMLSCVGDQLCPDPGVCVSPR